MNKTITSSLVRTAYKSGNKPQYAVKPHVSWGFLVLPHTQFHPLSPLFRCIASSLQYFGVVSGAGRVKTLFSSETRL